jgi:hypothetical protein
MLLTNLSDRTYCSAAEYQNGLDLRDEALEAERTPCRKSVNI